jgi:hypothetical protein
MSTFSTSLVDVENPRAKKRRVGCSRLTHVGALIALLPLGR